MLKLASKSLVFAKRLALAGVVGFMAVSSADAAFRTDRVPAYGDKVWTYDAYAGEWVYVFVRGDGDTDLDVIVHDPSGRVVRRCEGYTDVENCSFTARTAGRYRIEVKNLGNVSNVYSLRVE